MLEVSARFETAHGSKYLQQLCKHFAHKIVGVTYSETHGECRFSCGTAIMDADAQDIRFHVTAADEAQLQETQSVVERHLVRFAFRETVPALTWTA
jgi:hypothetical protein